ADSTSALAYRRVVHQHQRDVLLPLQHSGRLQSLHRELGSAGGDGRGGHRDHLGARPGTSPGSAVISCIGAKSALREPLEWIETDPVVRQAGLIGSAKYLKFFVGDRPPVTTSRVLPLRVQRT